MKENALAYYSEHSPMSDPKEYGVLLDGIGSDPTDMIRIIQGVLINPNEEEEIYDIRLSQQHKVEAHYRTVREMLEQINKMDKSPLSISRKPAERLSATYRHYALLLVSMLRYHHIPARMRVGYSRYSSEFMNEDRWIAEYWNAEQSRWVLVDPSISNEYQEFNELYEINPLDIQRNEQFVTAGQAWQITRSGELKADEFGYKKFRGMRMIRGSLLHDLDALNKVELMPWDFFGELITKDEKKLTREDKTLLDRIAGLTSSVDQNFEEMGLEYEDMPYSKAVRSKVRLMGGAEQSAEIAGSTIASASDILMKFNKDEQPLPASSNSMENESMLDRFFALSAPAETDTGHILVKGANQHNLKNVTIAIPHSKFVVITGVSGSGKSTLAFDTIHAEGQRRYLEHFGRYMAVPMEKPDVEQISGLSPTVAIEQKTIGLNPRSTVGSLTDIFDYLRLLFSQVGTSHCPECGRKLEVMTPNQIVETLKSIHGKTEIRLSAKISLTSEKAVQALRKKASGHGLHHILHQGELINWNEKERISSIIKEKSSFELVISQFSRSASPQEADRLESAVETALDFGKGILLVTLDEGQQFFLYTHNTCPYCDLVFTELTPQIFSSNSPSGMCPECNGLGVKLNVDMDKVITNPEISLLDGASPWYGALRQYKRSGNWMKSEIIALADAWNIDLEAPWRELPERFREAAFQGTGEENVHFTYEMEKRGRMGEIVRPVFGIIHHVNRLFRETKAENVRQLLLEFMSEKPCTLCKGEKLCPEGRSVSIGNIRFPEVSRMTIKDVHDWVIGLPHQLNARQLEISGDLLRELFLKLRSLLDVGLHYLSLERTAPTLSGGESQRIRLAVQLIGGLINMCYVLDEPSIGLHPRDHAAMIRTLQRLKEAGNTVLVVEHDAATMCAADWIIDMGPGAGILGGHVIASGTVQDIMDHPQSVTGQYLSGRLAIQSPNSSTRREPAGWLTVRNARLHNLKGIDVSIPTGVLTCVTGVSGSGKSTLVSRIFSPALSTAVEQRGKGGIMSHTTIEGTNQIDKVITIDQRPIGRTPRSNPATYVEVFDEIRKCFADLPESKAAGYKVNHFSFNSKGGRCETCEGHGKKQVEMHFMPDVWVTCTDCQGKRYNQKTLEIKYKGHSIFDVLEMDVSEALNVFAKERNIVRILSVLQEVGLSYIKLGQNALTLSGGEAQRIKLAKELSRVDTGKTVYILDEPTTGLHFSDIQKLVDLLHRLVDAGNTVILVEHNMDVVKAADWIIDMGPEGGDGGGQVVIEGTPENVSSCEESYTGRFLKQEMGLESGRKGDIRLI
ncbi:excinuclease ABC subunit UvrA [Paenibacillus sp. P46E]|uniref:excinuclease ABC subunit UvrA n=1 Tax=Paenibacillus sp. P46E TaxID=1349436 RepID=UPI000968C8BF|nr:excinuclease ABC subunit UvrA [Paenibacillus sp. P46E]OKP97467.1 hypothetical protein A3849_16530 [Paenibacillus sp. P46E]